MDGSWHTVAGIERPPTCHHSLFYLWLSFTLSATWSVIDSMTDDYASTMCWLDGSCTSVKTEQYEMLESWDTEAPQLHCIKLVTQFIIHRSVLEPLAPAHERGVELVT